MTVTNYFPRKQVLGDAIAAAEGTESPELRLVAAQLAAAHRVLYAEASRRSGRRRSMTA